MNLSLKLTGRQPLHTHNGFRVAPVPAIRSVLDVFRLGPSVADHVRSPNDTCVQRNRSGPRWASLLRDLQIYETLRVCGQRVSGRRGKSRLVCPDPPRAAKRYARNGFCVFARIPRNATHVLVSEHEVHLVGAMFIKFLLWPTSR